MSYRIEYSPETGDHLQARERLGSVRWSSIPSISSLPTNRQWKREIANRCGRIPLLRGNCASLSFVYTMILPNSRNRS